jgi:hypothetical protein
MPAESTDQVIPADQYHQVGLSVHLRFIHLLQDHLAQDRVQKAFHRIVLHIVHQNRQVLDRTYREEDHREGDEDHEHVLKYPHENNAIYLRNSRVS